MTSRKEKRRGARRCGSAQIELALVLLLLCLLLVVFIDFGRMLLVYNAVANAARAGVRWSTGTGSIPGRDWALPTTRRRLWRS